METQLLYMQVLYVPLNIRYPDLRKDCKDNNITLEYYKAFPRVFAFYCEEESGLRYIQTKHILKPFKE